MQTNHSFNIEGRARDRDDREAQTHAVRELVGVSPAWQGNEAPPLFDTVAAVCIERRIGLAELDSPESGREYPQSWWPSSRVMPAGLWIPVSASTVTAVLPAPAVPMLLLANSST